MIRALAAVALVALLASCEAAPQPQATARPTTAQTLPPPAQRTGPVGSTQRPLVMTLIPTQDAARAGASGKAIAAALEKATNLQWEVRVPASYQTTIEGLCAGEMDIAWLAPLAAVTARSKNCGEPLVAGVRAGNVTYQVQLLARTGSGVTALKDLKGKRIALVQSPASATSLATMAQVRADTGTDPKTFFASTIYATDDESAVKAVYQGQVDAAATFVDARDAVERTFPDVKQRTQRVATFGQVPNDGVSTRRALPADVRDRVEKALIDYARSDEGKRALKALYPIDGLDRIDAKLYDPLLEAARLMGIDLDREAAATARPAPSPTK